MGTETKDIVSPHPGPPASADVAVAGVVEGGILGGVNVTALKASE